MNTQQLIEKHLSKHKKGKVIFSKDLLRYGDYEAVKKALHRLAKKVKLERLSRDI